MFCDLVTFGFFKCLKIFLVAHSLRKIVSFMLSRFYVNDKRLIFINTGLQKAQLGKIKQVHYGALFEALLLLLHLIAIPRKS